jgi:hypothetical protein
MSRISIRKVISSSFSSYFEHIGTLLPMGMFIGSFAWLMSKFPRLLALSLGYASEQPINADVNFHPAVQSFMKMLGGDLKVAIVANNAHGKALISLVSLIMFVTYYWFYLGYATSLIDVMNGKKPSFSTMINGTSNLKSAVGSIALFFIGFIGFVAGSAVVIFLLSKVHPSLAIIAGLVAFFFYFFVVARLSLFLFCILDNKCGILESFHQSWRYTEGNVCKLLLTLFTGIILLMITMGIFHVVAHMIFSTTVSHLISNVVMGSTSGTLMALGLVSGYVQLKR